MSTKKTETAPVQEAKKEKKENIFFPFPRGTTTEENPCLHAK